MTTFLSTILTILLLLIHCDCKTKRFTREPKCGNTKHFRFDSELPTHKQGLSYCQYYRGETCCNKTHTDKIIKYIYAFHEPSVSSDCRDVSLNIGCSPCDPRVGTNQIKGICQSYCDNWFDKCRNDYFHYDKRGILTACSEKDIVCSKLSSIIHNGTRLCELSGFDISYVSISCYNGIKSTFKPPPIDREWETPFDKVWRQFKRTPIGKNVQLLLNTYAGLTLWQQLFVLGGFAYSLFAVFKMLMHCFGFKKGEILNSEIPDDIFNSDEIEKIRNKRLEKFAKETMIRNQMNMEAKLAKQLGLENDIINNENGLLNNQTEDLMIGNHKQTNDDNEQDSDD
eukprot:5546_1